MSQKFELLGLNARKERTGAVTLTAKWANSNYNDALFGTAPTQLNQLDLVSVEVEKDESGQMYIVTGIYEGGNAVDGGGGGGGGGDGDGSSVVYEWSPTFEQVDILTHPKIDDLLKKYKGSVDPESGSVRWEEELSEGQASGLGGQGKSTKNPMLGVREYLAMGGVWSKKSLRNSITNDLFESGSVVATVPGLTVDVRERFWLKMPSVVVSRGKKWEVTERWMLSGVKGARSVEAAKSIYEGQT